MVWVCLSLFTEINFPGNGTGAGNGVAAESTGIMTEVEGRDSLRPGTTWVLNRNAWEETGETSGNTNAQFFFVACICCCLRSFIYPWQGWPWWRPLPWGIWLGLWRWRRTQLWPTTALGPSWLAPHAATSWHSHSGEVRYDMESGLIRMFFVLSSHS